MYMYKKSLALNNQQLLICLKTKPNQSRGSYEPSFFPPAMGQIVPLLALNNP